MFGCVRSLLLNQIGSLCLTVVLGLAPASAPRGSAHLHVSECDPPGHRRGGQRMARQLVLAHQPVHFGTRS